MLKLQNINVSFDKKQIIEDISLEFKDKKLTCIFGASGSGKSTLIKVLPSLIAFSGKVFLNDVDLETLTPQELRRKILYVTQSASTPELTVKENLLMPFRYKSNILPIPTDDELVEMLNSVLLPTDYLNVSPEKLSGGERQRVHIARALLQKPEWLVLDEPTSALDIKAQDVVMKLIKEKSQEYGVIMVSHSVAMISSSDIKVHIDHGKVSNIWDSSLSSEYIADVINRGDR